jgi:Trk-type K+ transport system membrane component
MRSPQYGSVVTSAGQGRPWWCVNNHELFFHSLTVIRAFFTAASMFNDLGFTLTPDSMLSFRAAVFPLLLGSFLIIIGNTGFPCMLRFIIWLTSKFATARSPLWEELHFLLDHPRRCFTLLFPSAATWWLFWILVILNCLDLIFFIILDVCSPCSCSGSLSFVLTLLPS